MSSRGRARWERVYDDLRSQIDDKTLPPGGQLPSEFDLAGLHGVSRTTVRTALAQLTQEGLITEGRGRLGRTVRSYEPLIWKLHEFERGERDDDVNRGLDAWALGVEEQGHEADEAITAVDITAAPRSVCELLELPPKTMAVRRARIRSVDDVPYQLATSWFPEGIARDTPLTDPDPVTKAGGVLAWLGHPQKSFKDRVYIRMPSPEESHQLNLPAATPVAAHFRTGYGADGRPLRCMVTIAPGDRNVLAYEMEA